MDSLLALGHGFSIALMPVNLLYCFIGVLLGTVIGVIPGIGSLAAVSMLLPISFYLEPTTALIMLAGIYYGAQYGGSITAILVNLPGESASVVTAFDGNPLAKQGKAGVALFLTTIASFIGGTIGIILMVAIAPTLARLAIAFGPAEYFAVMVLGLVAAVTISSGSILKGFISIVLGLMLGVVGADPDTASQRFTFNFLELAEGVPLEAVAMGLFGVAEVLASVRTTVGVPKLSLLRISDMFPSRREWRESLPSMFRGSGVGAFFGTLPGAGVTIASFVSYSLEKKVSRRPETFGKGAIAGVSAPEAANNAAVQTAFIPTLTLGVPGSASMAVMLGALMIHNVLPGPTMITQHGDVFWGLIASFFMGNVMLLILNIPMINVWVRMLRLPYEYLYPMILLFVCIGVFSVRNSVFDVGVVMAFGLIGYGMRLMRFEPAPLLMAFVLGPQIEENLRRALTLSRGSLSTFLTSPISLVILVAALVLLVWSIVGAVNGTRQAYAEEEG